MFGIDLTDKIKAFAPYGIILYLLAGGSGAPEYQEIDNLSAEYVLEQIDQRTPVQGIRQAYFPYLPKKTHIELPAEANLPVNSMGDFFRKALQYPKKMLEGKSDNIYGY